MKSILGKLWVGIIVLVIVILGIVWLFQTVFLNEFYLNQRVNDLTDNGNKLVTLLEKEDINNIRQSTLEDIQYFSQQYNSKIDVIDKDKNIVLSSGTMGGPGMRMFSHFDISPVFTGQKISLQSVHPRFGTPVIFIGLPISSNSNVEGALLITTPLAPVKEASKVLQAQLSIITIISIAIATLLAFFLSRIFAKPILDVDQAARRIANGDYSVNLSIKSKDEVGRLGKTINELSMQLGKVDTLRKEFISNVSHELKTPLSIIKGYTELISDNLSEDERKQNKQNIDIILDETSRLDKMVKDMLLLSQMEAGFNELNISDFDISHLAEEVIKKVSVLTDIHKNKINLINKNKDNTVKGDREKINQVLINLVSNAIYHSHPEGVIEIYFESINDNEIKISIKDYGEGISEGDIKYVWDRFYKADKSRKRKESGTGLGMSIVKNILEAHKSVYGIQSKAGEGTTVWFFLKREVE